MRGAALTLISNAIAYSYVLSAFNSERYYHMGATDVIERTNAFRQLYDIISLVMAPSRETEPTLAHIRGHTFCVLALRLGPQQLDAGRISQTLRQDHARRAAVGLTRGATKVPGA